MSEYDDIERRKAEPPPEAAVHTTKWNPWLWTIPVLAIFFAGYLVVRYGFFGGGDITVKFEEARGLDRYSPVRFRGAKVGTVQKITIDENLGQVVVRIAMDASMNHALKKGTRFWIVEPGIEGGGLGSLLSGTYVGIAPGEGDETREFVGQEYAPILSPPAAGKTVVVEGQGAGSIAIGTPVQFQGMRVGRVLGSEYDGKRGVTSVHVFVVQRFANQLRQSTRFWRGGGLSFSLSGAGVSMAGGGGLAAILNSPISFYTPEVLPGAEVSNGTRFELYASEAAAVAAADGPQLSYVTYFPGPVRGLTAGTAVTMKGVQVGAVREVRLRYVPESGTLQTPVTFEIDPRKLELPVSNLNTRQELRTMMNGVLQTLVRKGMRATLGSSLILPGATGIALETVGRPGTAQLVVTTEPPIVPAATTGSGIEGVLGAINEVAARIRTLPLEEIAGNLRSTTARVNSLVSDPALSDSLRRLNASMADIQKVAATTRENIGPLTESLRNAAASAETAAARAGQLMGNASKQGYDLGELVKELTRAAESIRALATYLEEHPDSLLKGRGK
jgi:paraquat-inducible protein B